MLLGALGLLTAAFLLLQATGASALPPGYGFEKVSPDGRGKNDADIPIQVGSVRASSDGSRATWLECLASPTPRGPSTTPPAVG